MRRSREQTTFVPTTRVISLLRQACSSKRLNLLARRAFFTEGSGCKEGRAVDVSGEEGVSAIEESVYVATDN